MLQRPLEKIEPVKVGWSRRVSDGGVFKRIDPNLGIVLSVPTGYENVQNNVGWQHGSQLSGSDGNLEYSMHA